jgi:hypothetical protein
MLNLLDQTIRQVLDDGWTTTPPPTKPGFFFTVPDEDWLQAVKQSLGERLNIYLYEVRENREFRRAEWDTIDLPDRTVVLSRPPAYFDCYYLISAWSAAENSEALNPILDEHLVLSEALRVLMLNPEVTPATLGIAGGGPVFQQARICLTVAPPEPSRVLNDFWSTMKLPWRPAIQLIATAPLDLLRETTPAPPVTTFIQRYARIAGTALDEWILVGGWVLNDADDSPIPNATVTRVATGEATNTDAQGRYSFVGLRQGIHRFRAEAPGMAAIERDVDIPTAPPDDHVFRLS